MVDDAPRAVRVPGSRRHRTIHRPRLRRAVGPPAPVGPDPGEHSARLRALRQGSARRDWPRRWAAGADARRRAYFAHHALRRHERVAPLWTGADGPLVEHALDTSGCGLPLPDRRARVEARPARRVRLRADARDALERLRRKQRITRRLTLSE